MNLSAAQIRFLIERGFTAEDLANFAELASATFDPTGAERTARYRSRMDVSPVEWHALREQVFERDGWACTYCGDPSDLHCDHIMPLVQGGKSTLDNLTTACRACNCGKSGRTVEQWRGLA